MTTAPEQRTATLTELVAQEIDAVRGRKRMSQAQLAKLMGKTPMWVSLRLRGRQPIDMNDLWIFARALGIGVHELLPSPEVVAGAADPSATVAYLPLTSRFAGEHARGAGDSTRPRTNRPVSGPPKSAPPAAVRTVFLSRTARLKRA